MKKEIEYSYWQDGDWYLGYLHEQPEHWTQGKTLAELEEMLLDLYNDARTETAYVPPPSKKTGVLSVVEAPA